MGWLELLALMKRVLPLLGRVAPMLETYVAARGATRGDSEALDRMSGDLRAHLVTATQNHTDLKDTLDSHGARLQHLSDELRNLRSDDLEKTARMEQMERQVASTTRSLRTISILILILLLICLGLLTALLLRR